MPKKSLHTANSVTSAAALLVREASGEYRPAVKQEVLSAATSLLHREIQGACFFTAPKDVRDYLVCRLGALEHEVFGMVCVDAQHRVIDYVELFRGTVNCASVYAREVVKEALARNAVSVVLVHNHPSGCLEPSSADKKLTEVLSKALGLIDISVMDHFIVGGAKTLSFAEEGLL